MLPGAPIALPDPGSLEELEDHAKVQRGHSALERPRCGRTAAMVVKHAPCEVRVVRADAAKVGIREAFRSSLGLREALASRDETRCRAGPASRRRNRTNLCETPPSGSACKRG